MVTCLIAGAISRRNCPGPNFWASPSLLWRKVIDLGLRYILKACSPCDLNNSQSRYILIKTLLTNFQSLFLKKNWVIYQQEETVKIPDTLIRYVWVSL